MREIQISDCDEVFALCLLLKKENARMSFTDVEDKSQIEAWLNNPNIYLYGAFSDSNELLGLLKATRGEGNKSHSAYLAAAVNPAYRKLSIASNLTRYGCDALKREGVLIARTYIYSWNTASIATIEKSGFTLSGRVVMHEFDAVLNEYIDDLIYYKFL